MVCERRRQTEEAREEEAAEDAEGKAEREARCREAQLRRLTVSDTGWFLDQLWAPLVAVTAAHAGRTSGLISSTALNASLVPEAPRLSLHLSAANLTHDLALASAAFAVHLLPADNRGLELFHALGTRTGHEVDKLADIRTSVGTTSAPLLADAVAYAEVRIVRTLDCGEFTFVFGDVVAARHVAEADTLTIEHARAQLPAQWLAEWERRYEVEVQEARRRR